MGQEESLYELTLEFDMIPMSLNKVLNLNPFVRNKYNKNWYTVVALEATGRHPPVPLQKARIRIVRHYYRFLDYDGLVGSMKPVVDGLQHAQIIVNDGWKCTQVWDVFQKAYPKGQEKLIVQVRDGSS